MITSHWTTMTNPSGSIQDPGYPKLSKSTSTWAHLPALSHLQPETLSVLKAPSLVRLQLLKGSPPGQTTIFASSEVSQPGQTAVSESFASSRPPVTRKICLSKSHAPAHSYPVFKSHTRSPPSSKRSKSQPVLNNNPRLRVEQMIDSFGDQRLWMITWSR